MADIENTLPPDNIQMVTPLIHPELAGKEKDTFSNILLIHDQITDYNTFISSANATTFPIVYSINSSKADLLKLLQEHFSSIQRIGVCFHSSGDTTKLFLDNQSLFTEEDINSDNDTEKSENVEWLLDVIKDFQVKNIDFLACDSLQYPNWVNYFNLLQNSGSNVIVGASNDKTGNLKYGGDWIMESTHEDIEFIYFTENIEYYKYLLYIEVKINGIIYKLNNNLTAFVPNSNGNTVYPAGTIFDIPTTVTYLGVVYNVTALEGSPFAHTKGLVRVIFPNTITAITWRAFFGAYDLQSVYIPSSVTSIADGAFSGCGRLTTVDIPDSVTNFETYVFNGSSIVNMTLPSYLGFLPNGTFDGCDSLTYVNLRNNINKISWQSFLNCTSLTSIIIPNSVVVIETEAFKNCKNLKTVYFLSTTTLPSFGTSVFLGIASSSTAYYNPNVNPSSIMTLGFTYVVPILSYTINGTTATVSSGNSNKTYYTPIIIPSVYTDSNNISYNVVGIDDNAFRDCSGITSIVIPNSITTVGASAFYNCSSITSIIVPSSVTSIGDNAFYNCSSVTNFTIPSSITNIGSSAFYNCSRITNFTIPVNVSSIGDNTFYNCSSVTNFTIPSNITSIGNSAFYNCSSVTNFTIPSSITSIGSSAFYNCSRITNFTIPVNVSSIGANTFYNCSGLTIIDIPNTITSIGVSAFLNCTNLKSVYFLSNTILPSLGTSAFVGNAPSNTAYYLTSITNTNIAATFTAAGFVNYAMYPTVPTFTNFSPITTKTFGDSPYSLIDPSSNSTGAFSYDSSNINVASISGNTVTISRAGTTTITVTQQATHYYTSATRQYTLTISGIPPTITNFYPSSITKTFGDASFDLIDPSSNSKGAFTYTTSDPSYAIITNRRNITIVRDGSVNIIATQEASGNYTSGTATTSLRINKATPTITNFYPSSITKTFGDVSFDLMDPSSNSKGAFTYTTSDPSYAIITNGKKVTIVGAGTATITASQEAIGNYTSGTATTTLRINKATPTITNFNPITKTIGDASFHLIDPSSNSTGAFTYNSSRDYVAAISDRKKVTIKDVGVTIIYATQEPNGNYSAGDVYTSLTINPINSVRPTITNFPSLITKTIGDASFHLMDPSSNSMGAFTYNSSNNSVATISDGKKVTIKDVGSTIIYATQEPNGNYSAGTATTTLIINPINSVTPTITNFYPLSIAKNYGDLSFNLIDPSSNSRGAFTYNSSNISVATISDGKKVTIKNVGNSIITATQEASGNYTSGTATTTLTVRQVKPITPKITKFSINPKTYGDLSFNLIDPSSNSMGAFTYTSSNTSVATISDGRTVTIKGAGNSIITATQAIDRNYKSGTIRATLRINRATPILTGFDSPITRTYGDNIISLTDPSSNSTGAFTYTSSNTSIAKIISTVNGKTIQILKALPFYITVRQAANSNYNLASARKYIYVNKANTTLTLSVAEPITKTLNTTSSFLIPTPISNRTGVFTYISSDPLIASVSRNSIRMLKVGQITITATQLADINYNSATITMTLNITPPITVNSGSLGLYKMLQNLHVDHEPKSVETHNKIRIENNAFTSKKSMAFL